MNNSELFVAIEATFNMIKALSSYEDHKKILIKHFGVLLDEQLKRTKEYKKND